MFKNAILPILVIFGLDYTLWPYWIDPRLSEVRSPFSRTNSGMIVDINGKSMHPYPDVPKIFEKLKNKGIKIAVTSYTLDLIGTHELLRLFDLEKDISYTEVQETIRKIDQLKRIHDASNISYSDMIFFDDILGNVMDATEIGIHSIYIENGTGINMKIVDDALAEFEAKRLNKVT